MRSGANGWGVVLVMRDHSRTGAGSHDFSGRADEIKQRQGAAVYAMQHTVCDTLQVFLTGGLDPHGVPVMSADRQFSACDPMYQYGSGAE